jgi:hypothetical protein
MENWPPCAAREGIERISDREEGLREEIDLSRRLTATTSTLPARGDSRRCNLACAAQAEEQHIPAPRFSPPAAVDWNRAVPALLPTSRQDASFLCSGRQGSDSRPAALACLLLGHD